MKLKDYDISTVVTATVRDSHPITTPKSKVEVRDILLEVEDKKFSAAPGQSVGVLAPGQREIGQDKHFRLYSVADAPHRNPRGHLELSLCVRRCSYVDEFSGEEYPGLASNYLCDLRPGDSLQLTGPYHQAFELPSDDNVTLIFIGAGTGIAPFRAIIKHLYAQCPNFQGRVWVFHGAQTGLDLLYRNSELDDFASYYDRGTFEAFDALSNRPHWSDTSDWGQAISSRAEQLKQLLADEQTYVYLAGLEKIRTELDEVLAGVFGSSEAWDETRDALQADGRWNELLY